MVRAPVRAPALRPMAGISRSSALAGASSTLRSWTWTDGTSGRSRSPVTTDSPRGPRDRARSKMRITTSVASLIASILFVAAVAATAPQQTEIRTTIGGASGRLPRLAIPLFLITGTDAQLPEVAKTLTDVLWKDLEFEREFQMISQSGAAQIAPAPADALVYESWNQIGADDVLVGSVLKTDTTLQVDVRVMNVERKVSTFAKRYTCSVRGVRLCAHTIADELHKERFGLEGVARTKLAFTSDRDGERLGGTIEQRSIKEIYISDYDGQRANRVTIRGSLNIAPAWAPDSRSIAYQSYQTGFVDIYIQKLYEVQVQLEIGRAHV